MNLSDNLKRIRKENNLSQEDLAEKLNVSRQSVSKWEQGIAYPEMDKVLQICKMFNLSVDELLNQNIKEVENNNKSKVNINKYIDEILSYISKTVNMFSSMKFKDKFKCIFEQLLLIGIFLAISAILKGILGDILHSILSFLPEKIYYPVQGIFNGVYILIMCILCIIFILHTFKTRYLDYYVIVENEIEEEKKEQEKEEVKEETIATKKEEKKFIKENRDRVIIRDEKHSEYGVFKVLFKIILVIIKFIVFTIALPLCASFVSLIMCLVSTFIIVKSGILFLGAFFGVFGLLLGNFIILYVAYNIIVSRKNNLLFIFAIFISALVFCGVGAGLCINSIKDFKVINQYNEKYMNTNETTFDMKKDTVIQAYEGDVEYIEENRKDIRIVYECNKYNKVVFATDENFIYYYLDTIEENIPDYIISNLNDKVFVNPEYLKIRIYASKNNIKTLKENRDKYISNEEIKAKNRQISELMEELDEVRDELEETRSELEEARLDSEK